MALLLMDGFDWPAATADLAQQWRNNDAVNITLDSTGNAWGGKALRMTDSAASSNGLDGLFQELYQAPSGSTIRIFFRIKTSASFAGSGVAGTVGSNFPNGGEALIKLQSLYEATSGAPCLSIGLNSSGFIVVMRGEDATSNARTAAAIGAAAVNDGNWHRVEIEIVINTTTGSVKTWVDGTADINSTSIDTDDFAAGRGLDKCTTLALGMGKNNATNTEVVWFDDVVVWDDSGSDFTGGFTGGDLRIQTLVPNANGDTNQFTPLSGSNYLAVDDPLTSAADDDSSYVETTTSGHVDLYNYPSWIVYPSDVYLIKTSTRAKVTTNGRVGARAKAKVSTTTANGSTKQVWDTNYIYIHQAFGKQPGGSGWDRSSLAAAQFGIERL